MLTISYDPVLKAFSLYSDERVDVFVTEKMLKNIKAHEGRAIKVDLSREKVIQQGSKSRR